MTILIVENDPGLATCWESHLSREGAVVRRAGDADAACALISSEPIRVLVVDLDLPGGGALAVADYASFRQPEARVIFVTANRFFSDGSIFGLSSNAAGYLGTDTPPEDLAALVDHHNRLVPGTV